MLSLGGRSSPFDSIYREEINWNRLKLCFLQESLSYCKHVSGDPVSNTLTPVFLLGFTTLEGAETHGHAHTHSGQVKTPSRAPSPPLKLQPSRAGRGRFSVLSSSISPPPEPAWPRAMVPSSIIDQNCQPLVPLLCWCPRLALCTPKCALRVVHLGPTLRLASDIRTLAGHPPWSPQAEASLSVQLPGLFQEGRAGRVSAEGGGRKKPQGEGRFTIGCTRILTLPLPEDYGRRKSAGCPPSPFARAGKAEWGGCPGVRESSRGALGCQANLPRGVPDAPVILPRFQVLRGGSLLQVNNLEAVPQGMWFARSKALWRGSARCVPVH